MLAKSKEEEIKKYGADNVTFVDSGLSVNQMEDELAGIIAEQDEVSLDEAMRELEGIDE